MKNLMSLEGPVLKVNGELLLLVPLEENSGSLCSPATSEMHGGDISRHSLA